MVAWFDSFARDYDQWYLSKIGNFIDKVEKELIADLAKFNIGENVLDIGSGTGTYSIWMNKLGLNVTSIDQSKEMINIAKEKASKEKLNIDWILGDAHVLPFPNQSFDLVVSVTAIEFMDNYRVVLNEAMRVLKPNGRLVIGVLTKNSPWGELYQEMAKNDPNNLFSRAHLFTEDEVVNLFDAEFKLKKGLYIPPSDNFNEEDAWISERKLQEAQAENAGFFAIRWNKG